MHPHRHPSLAGPTLNRRGLLRNAVWTGIGGVSLLTLPAPLRQAVAAGTVAEATGIRWDRTLVALHLGGGNDGLNTVVPYADPEYRRLRPRLALPADQILQLDERFGLHPSLEPLRALWNGGSGDLAFGLGLGYPEQNRSHFRSIEIWETASDSEEFLTDGWMGRLFATADSPDSLDADGVVLAGSGLSLSHPAVTRVALPTGSDLSTPNLVAAVDPASQIASVGHTMRTQATLADAAAAFAGVSTTPLPVETPTTQIGGLFRTAAQVIVAGKAVPVIMLSHGSYDTHAGQLTPHATLLRDLAAALAAFRACMVAAGKWNDVAVMTFAEFGRRVAENGSQGTDHGSAACHLFMGGSVAGGFHGAQLPLTDLENGDLKHTTDFRQVYTAVARSFWNMPQATADAAIGSFGPLPLFKGGLA